MGQKKPIKIQAKLNASYTTTSAWANVSGAASGDFQCVASEDGYWDLSVGLTNQINANEGCTFSFGINNNNYGSQVYSYLNNVNKFDAVTLIEPDVYLKKGDIVTVRAIYINTATAVYVDATIFPVLTITKKG